MTPKQVLFKDAARARIMAGIETLAAAVRVTLGPKARTVMIERPYGAPLIINSGVIVAKEIELKDPFENMGAQVVREVSSRTSEDRKSTRLNSSHSQISYAVFCLKKKTPSSYESRDYKV